MHEGLARLPRITISILRSSWGYSEIDVERVEKEMAYFYMETFFVTFGREPVLPRRLTYMPNDLVSEQRQRAQVARPGWEHE